MWNEKKPLNEAKSLFFENINIIDNLLTQPFSADVQWEFLKHAIADYWGHWLLFP